MSSKKPNKKYNPNKLAHQRMAKQNALLAKWRELDVLYEFNMKFAIEEVNDIVDAYVAEHGLSENDYVPAHVTVGAYECQDLIIAMKKQMIKTPEFWEVGIDSHFYNAELHDVLTIPFVFDIPSISHAELMGGKEGLRIILAEDGFKKVIGDWEGLQPAMIENWKREGVPDGYELIKSQVSITAYAHFQTLESHGNFQFYLRRRDEGELLTYLEFEEKVGYMIDQQKDFIGAA